jgi:hypothetical protein
VSERRAWLCAHCAQFLTRPGHDVAPSHDCPVTASRVALIEYIDSAQAEQLRHSVNATH